MPTPNARQIIFATSVVPKKTDTTTDTRETLEDGTVVGVAPYTDTVLDTTIGKKFGGKGTVEINRDQALQGWIEVGEAQDEIDGLEEAWEATNTTWDELVSVPSTDKTIRYDSATCNFVYVKNTGSTEVRLYLDGTEPDILIPAGASVATRLNNVSADDIKVDTESGTSTIEFVVAKA